MKRSVQVRVVSIVIAGNALVMGSSAQAHVHAKPTKVTAGSTTSVAFEIKHGCAGSPTTKVTMKAPVSVTKLSAKAPTGWAASVSGQVVTFSGGVLLDKKLG